MRCEMEFLSPDSCLRMDEEVCAWSAPVDWLNEVLCSSEKYVDEILLHVWACIPWWTDRGNKLMKHFVWKRVENCAVIWTEVSAAICGEAIRPCWRCTDLCHYLLIIIDIHTDLKLSVTQYMSVFDYHTYYMLFETVRI